MKNKKGFTIVELISVVAILGILIAFVSFGIMRKLYDKAKTKMSENEIKALTTQAEVYGMEREAILQETKSEIYTVQDLINAGYLNSKDYQKYAETDGVKITYNSTTGVFSTKAIKLKDYKKITIIIASGNAFKFASVDGLDVLPGMEFKLSKYISATVTETNKTTVFNVVAKNGYGKMAVAVANSDGTCGEYARIIASSEYIYSNEVFKYLKNKDKSLCLDISQNEYRLFAKSIHPEFPYSSDEGTYKISETNNNGYYTLNIPAAASTVANESKWPNFFIFCDGGAKAEKNIAQSEYGYVFIINSFPYTGAIKIKANTVNKDQMCYLRKVS